MLQKVEYRVALAEDRSTATIETLVDGQAQAWSDTSPEELSEIIEMFTHIRAEMSDEIPTELEPNAKIAALINPYWKITPAPNQDGVVLAIRHPGAGWMGFYLPSSSAQHLKKLLNEALS